ncbi:hypothetical protein HFP89_11480 [Wenzhouxiangella sp. XN79A]|uniref:hypothetical protein n=1 Tax=Wenzhouxiangella sp. XN79A TaxID=2724193 RepID=UPI00144AE7AE|nr:hypothetical protein [Wenzhouxiangella sp. XN79A]NKI35783.1 hypothetical protein [Wenzhouxiangella sp. XN79A]
MQSMFRTRRPIVAGALVALLGAVLAGGKVIVDGEPGAIPLGLIVAGVLALIVGKVGQRRARAEIDR